MSTENLPEHQKAGDEEVWWKSMKKGDRVTRVLLPGDEGYEEALEELRLDENFRRQQQLTREGLEERARKQASE